jgi:hypothetical protein
VSDLKPLRGRPLVAVYCVASSVTDLSPLAGMAIVDLRCNPLRAEDHPLIREMPLVNFWTTQLTRADENLLRSLKTLNAVNGIPAAEFWKERDLVRADFDTWAAEVRKRPPAARLNGVVARLIELNGSDGYKVKEQVRNGKIVLLHWQLSPKMTDISPFRALDDLESLTLSALEVSPSPLSDLAPLRGLALQELSVQGLKNVKDVSFVKGMPLEKLNIKDTGVTDLSPLMGLKKLGELQCDYVADRDAVILRAIPTLETINDQPAAKVLKTP